MIGRTNAIAACGEIQVVSGTLTLSSPYAVATVENLPFKPIGVWMERDTENGSALTPGSQLVSLFATYLNEASKFVAYWWRTSSNYNYGIASGENAGVTFGDNSVSVNADTVYSSIARWDYTAVKYTIWGV